MSKRLTIEDYHAIAVKRGFVWLGPEVLNNRTKTAWRCKLGHEWRAPYSDLQCGQGCPRCGINSRSEKRRVNADQYHELAAKYGLEWVGDGLPESTRHKTLWKCANGHVFESRYNQVQYGHGCAYCAGVAPKSPEDYHSLASRRGIRWLGPEVENIKTDTNWECPNGHQWLGTYNDIHNGHCCKQCGIAQGIERRRFKEEKYHEIVRERGIEWIGASVPKNNATKTRWRCPRGHEWEARRASIQQGGNCPVCARDAQRKYRSADQLRELHRIYTSRRAARKLGLPNTFTTADWQRTLGYFNGCCAVCGHPLYDLFGTHTAAADHWIALSDPRPDNPGTVATNIVCLCHGSQGCNNSKKNHPAEKWLIERFGKRRAREILKRIETYFQWVREQDGGE